MQVWLVQICTCGRALTWRAFRTFGLPKRSRGRLFRVLEIGTAQVNMSAPCLDTLSVSRALTQRDSVTKLKTGTAKRSADAASTSQSD